MLLQILLFFVGLGALLAGAEMFVKGASRLAEKIGIPSLVIGLTLVSFGTSAPELAVSLNAGFSGETDITLGNVVGSNICNVLFILGTAAAISPLVIDRQLIRQEVPLMILVSILVWVLSTNGLIGFTESILLVLLLISYVGYVVYRAVKSRDYETCKTETPGLINNSEIPDRHWSLYILLLVLGLGLLIAGSDWLIGSAIFLAETMGISNAIVGLTVIALGTSLPEAATSIIAGIRGEQDIAVGNIVGSNIFNILGILGISGVLIPGNLPVSAGIIHFDLPVMIAVAVACLPVFFTGYTIARWEGFVFLGYYLAYFLYLFLNLEQHILLPFYSDVMLLFVIPLTVVTITVITYREYVHRQN